MPPAAGSRSQRRPAAARSWRSRSRSGRRIEPALAELAVEVHGRADQREMRERLREVPERLAGWADLLGVEPEVIRVGEHLLEGQPGLVDAAGAGQRLDVPERTDREGALIALQAVGRRLGVVAVDEAVGDQLAA